MEELLGLLDAPRQALWNLAEGIGDTVTGNATAETWQRMLPGALGAIAGLATGGFASPLVAALVGSGVGGAGQAVASGVDPERFAAQTPGALAQRLGLDEDVGGFALGLLTDPLTFAGGLGGLRAGRQAGNWLNEGAAIRGPRYGTTADDLAAMTGGQADFRLQDLLSSPNSGRVLSEVPPGSQFLGSGAEAMAFRTPAGDALRVGRVPVGEPGRAVAPDVLQSTRAVDVPGGNSATALRVERTPFADQVNDQGYWWARDDDGLTRMTAANRGFNSRGVDLADFHAGNVGLRGGRPVVIDPGAYDVLDGFNFARQPVLDASRPVGGVRNTLLDLLGSDRSMRRALDAGRPGVDYGRPLGLLGALGGGLSGGGVGGY